MDPEDNNNKHSNSECKEETGLDITNLRLVLRYIKMVIWVLPI
jgi:hypothetical protein